MSGKDPEKIRSRIIRYCAYRERSTSEVRSKLKELRVKPQLQEKLLTFLLDEGFVNDERFSEVFTNGHFRLKKWGRNKIRIGLIQKGIDESTIQRALEGIDTNEYVQTLKLLAENKYKSLDISDEFVRKGKTAAYLARKGYESDLIWEQLNSFS